MRFWHTLAGHLKIDTVEGLKRRMSSAEFTDWMAFASHEPIGQDRLDFLCGLIRSDLDAGFYLVAKSNGASFSQPKEWKSISELMPQWWEREKPTIRTTQTVEEQDAILSMFFGSMGIKKQCLPSTS